MLVCVQPGADSAGQGLSGAEARFAELLRSWTGPYAIPGVAMLNTNVASERGGVRQVDAVIWSPHGCVVVEVKGFTRRQDGQLWVPLNGPWQMGGAPAALHNSGTTNPLEQMKTNLYAVKNTLNTAGVDAGFLSGLVVVVPFTGAQINIAYRRLGKGTKVVVGAQNPLRRYFHELGERPKVWSVDDVGAAFAALDLLTYLPTRAELLADGFPDLITHSVRPRQHTPRAAPTPPRPTTTTASPRNAATGPASDTAGQRVRAADAEAERVTELNVATREHELPVLGFDLSPDVPVDHAVLPDGQAASPAAHTEWLHRCADHRGRRSGSGAGDPHGGGSVGQHHALTPTRPRYPISSRPTSSDAEGGRGRPAQKAGLLAGCAGAARRVRGPANSTTVSNATSS